MGLCILSLGIPFLHYRFLEGPIEGFRVGGLHPTEMLGLRDLGSFSRYPPVVALVALIISFVRPSFTRFLLPLCTTAFVIYITVYLFQCLMAVALYIAPPHA